MKRVGIYAGTFDPVHAGHIAFALQAIQSAQLDRVYFLPERRPRHKTGVEHFGHRVAMLNRALRPHPKLKVLETDDISFSIKRTLPRLQQQFGTAKLVLLMGSDVAQHLENWPNANRLFGQCDIVIGLREMQDTQSLLAIIEKWKPQPANIQMIKSYAPDISSHNIREALAARTQVRGLLTSVARYSNRHWLYVSLA